MFNEATPDLITEKWNVEYHLDSRIKDKKSN